MNEALLAELLESIRNCGMILRGEKEPLRKFVFQVRDVKPIREGYNPNVQPNPNPPTPSHP